MQNYLDLLNKILTTGTDSSDRTGTGTLSLFGEQLRFNLREGFPAITTKKLAWKPMLAELLWFLEGSGDERRLAEIQYGSRDTANKTIWTANANADYWTHKAKYPGDAGRIYGVQWRNWKTENGSVDQIATLIDGLKNDPYSRRHILTAWNVGELDQMALPPCHLLTQFYVRDNNLSCQVYIRSNDIFLGNPFNIASYAVLTHMIAHVCDMGVADLVLTIGDAHIYKSHLSQVTEQLTRTHMPLPRLWINSKIKSIDQFTMDDVKLVDYESYPSLTAPMAV
jgi:thymidylate synthase